METNVTLRPASLEDCRKIWQWRNDPETRKASFRTELIPYREHLAWFERKWKEGQIHWFILVSPAGKEVGFIRWDLKGTQAEIGLSIDKGHRGKGYGTEAIRQALKHLVHGNGVRQVIAHIKPESRSSLRAFEKAGFIYQGPRIVEGTRALLMAWKGHR